MKHWHVVFWGPKGVFAALRYDNAAKSVSDFLDMSYEIFEQTLEDTDRMTYSMNMLKVAEDFEGYHIYNGSEKLNLSWTDCDSEPCSFANYN